MPNKLMVFAEEGEDSITIELFEKATTTRSGTDTGANKNLEKAKKTFQQALAPVRQIANDALAQVRQFNESPAEVTLEMGIKISGEANAVVTKVNGEAHFNLVIKWTHESMTRARENNPTSKDEKSSSPDLQLNQDNLPT